MRTFWTNFDDNNRTGCSHAVVAFDHFEFKENSRPIVCFNMIDEENKEIRLREEILFFYESTKNYNTGTKGSIVFYVKDNDYFDNRGIVPLVFVDSIEKIREFGHLSRSEIKERIKEETVINDSDKNNLLQYFGIKIPYNTNGCQGFTFYFHDLNTKEFVLRHNNSFYYPTLVYRYRDNSTNKLKEEELFFKHQLDDLINLLPKKEEDPIAVEYNKRIERGVRTKEVRIKNTSKKKVSYIIMTNGSYNAQKVRYYFENGQSISEAILTKEGIDINTTDFQIHAFSKKSNKDTILLSNEFFNIEDLKLSKHTVNGIEMIEVDLSRAKNSVLALIPLKINKEALDRVLSPENRLLLELV